MLNKNNRPQELILKLFKTLFIEIMKPYSEIMKPYSSQGKISYSLNVYKLILIFF